ncbi:MAG: lamin tail domain-containing protein [Myxococcales bacterium]|nr:lamin tail domain-containing protein [Myxococcales bacterium]
MINRFLPAFLAVGTLAISTGCPNRPQASLPAPAPASITLFTVEPRTTSPGQAVVLEWGTNNALDVTIEQVGQGPVELGDQKTGGRLSITVTEDTVFLITAQGAGGTDVKATSVTVQRKARSVLFSAVPSTVEAGAATTLVWNAPGARTVRLEEVGGAAIDVGTQLESGSVRITPTRSTTYRLQADDFVATTRVTVAPTVVTFTAGATVPSAGEPVELSWTTVSASSVTLRRVGLATALPVPAGQVEAGRFTDTVPTNLPPDAVLTYVLEVSDGTTMSSRALEVPVGGGVRINTFTAPSYALSGSTFPISWTTIGGESAELIVDGRRAYLAQSRAEVASGSYTLSAPTQSTRVEFIVRNGRGAEAREARTIEGVGPISYNFFRADKTSIAAAGEPVTLSWSIANARAVRITSNSGAGFYRQFTGPVDSGSLVVLPNSRPPSLTRLTYRLEADNGTGSAPVVHTIDVEVGTPATFTFSRQLPVRAPNTVTGISTGTATQVSGFKNIEKNPAGEAFIDIRTSGTPMTFGTANASNVLLPTAFQATLFGTRVNATRLNVSRYGWFNLTTSSTAISGRPENDPRLGNALEPLTIAPFWNDLATAANQVHWRVDAVSDARRLIVQWTNVRPTNGPVDSRVTFQAQVHSNGKIVFAYRDFLKVPRQGTVGVVNNSESDEVSPSMPVVSGDVYRFFARQAVPANMTIEATPFAGFALINGDPMEAEGTANYPLNQFAVSEVNYRPASSVTNGLWIEIGSNSDAGVDLGGWDVDFGGVQTFQIPMGTILEPFGKLLLAQAADLGDPGDGGLLLQDGGVEAQRRVDAVLPSTFVPPATDVVVRIGIGGNEYTRFPSATSTLPNDITPGFSYALEDQRSPWVTYATPTLRFICESVRPGYGSNGQRGSPGSANQSCFPYEAPAPTSRQFQSMAGNGTRINFQSFGSPDDDEGVAVVQLTQPINLYGVEISTLTIGANGAILPYAASSVSFINKSAPSSSAPTFVIAPHWSDLDGTANAGANAYFRQEANGDVYVSWENWGHFDGPASIDMQAVLYANGDVEYRYGALTGGPLALGSAGTTWIDIGPAASSINVNSPSLVPNTAFYYQLALNR